MSLIRPKAITLLTYQPTLYIEPNQSYVTPWIDRTTLPTFAEMVSVQMQGQSGGTLTPDGKVNIHVVAFSSINAGDAPITNAASNGQILVDVPYALWKIGAIKAGELDFKLGSITESRGLRFNAAKVFGGVIPTKWAVVVENLSGLQVRNPGNPIISVQGFQAETV